MQCPSLGSHGSSGIQNHTTLGPLGHTTTWCWHTTEPVRADRQGDRQKDRQTDPPPSVSVQCFMSWIWGDEIPMIFSAVVSTVRRNAQFEISVLTERMYEPLQKMKVIWAPLNLIMTVQASTLSVLRFSSGWRCFWYGWASLYICVMTSALYTSALISLSVLIIRCMSDYCCRINTPGHWCCWDNGRTGSWGNRKQVDHDSCLNGLNYIHVT